MPTPKLLVDLVFLFLNRTYFRNLFFAPTWIPEIKRERPIFLNYYLDKLQIQNRSRPQKPTAYPISMGRISGCNSCLKFQTRWRTVYTTFFLLNLGRQPNSKS